MADESSDQPPKGGAKRTVSVHQDFDKVESGGKVTGVENSAPVSQPAVSGNFYNAPGATFITPPPSFTSTFSGPPRRLPLPVADFTGREQELEQLRKDVETGGVTISGVRGLGGIGKTQLALKLAQQICERYPDGQLMIDLGGPDSARALPARDVILKIINTFYPEVKPVEDILEMAGLYRQALAGKRVLLLLDNAATADQIQPLLPPPTGCLVLVTSRRHLYLPMMKDVNLDRLPPDEAEQFLLSIEPRIGQHAQALAQVCGCLPLALRNVAKLLHINENFRPQDVLDSMADATERLSMTEVDASLTLSDQSLRADLRSKWYRLGVFAGDFALDAVPRVWGTVSEKTTAEQEKRARVAALKDLGALLEYSLVIYEGERYRLHDLVRDYTLNLLDEKEQYSARLAHARYYCNRLIYCEDLYKKGNEKILEGLALFDRERTEILTGQAWAAEVLADRERKDDRLTLLNEYSKTGFFTLAIRQHPREQIRWLDAGLRAARQLGDQWGEGAALCILGNAYRDLGEPKQAIVFYEQYLVIARDIGNRSDEGTALGNLGLAYSALGETRRAIEFCEQALVIEREIGDRRGEGADLGNLGNAYSALGETRRAIELYEQHLAIAREIGDRQGEGNALGSLGIAYRALGETRRAIELYEQRLAIAREIGDRQGEGNALGNLGNAYSDLGETRRAIELYEQRLAIAREIGDRRGEALGSWNLGLAYESQGDLTRAVELMQVCVDYERELGHPDAEKDAAQVEDIRKRIRG